MVRMPFMPRRAIFKWACVALLALGLAMVMSLRRGEAGPPAGRVVVTYWEKWTGREAQQMRQIVDEFNRTVGAEKGIWVQYLSISGVDRRTLVATAAGVPPDVAGLWDIQVPQFAAMDALEPLDELAAEHGISAATYKPVYWRSCSYGGRLWALVSTPYTIALLYNRAIIESPSSQASLRQAGLDPTVMPRTIDELDRWAQALDVRDASGRLERAGFLPMEPPWWMPYLPSWFGGSMYDEAADRFTATDPAVVAAFEWVHGYARRLGAAAVSDFRSGLGQNDSPQNPFMAGKVVMTMQGPWMANFIEHNAPAMNRGPIPRERELDVSPAQRRGNYQWAVMPCPSAVPGVTEASFATADVLMIPRGARHKREAFEFIAYVNRQDVMERLCSLHCKNSPLADVSEGFIQRHPNPYIDVFERLAASPDARGIPRVPILMEAVDEINAMSQRVILLKQEPGPALAQVQARLEQAYQRYKQRQSQRRSPGTEESP